MFKAQKKSSTVSVLWTLESGKTLNSGLFGVFFFVVVLCLTSLILIPLFQSRG